MLSKRLQTTLHKKILCNFALILLGQHCTDRCPMQCCPRGSRQYCIKKNPCNFALILLGQHCTAKTLCNVAGEACDNFAYEKCSVQCQRLMQSWSYALLSQRLLATLHRKKFRQFRQCRLNNVWSLSLHMYISGPSRQKKIQLKLCFLYYENQL